METTELIVNEATEAAVGVAMEAGTGSLSKVAKCGGIVLLSAAAIYGLYKIATVVKKNWPKQPNVVMIDENTIECVEVPQQDQPKDK